jgi:hypothetical protein
MFVHLAKASWRVATRCALVGVLTGCLNTEVPFVSDSMSQVDEGLLGDWVTVPAQADSDWKNNYPIRMRVSAFDEERYLVVLQNASDPEAGLLHVYTTTVGGKGIAVCRGLGETYYVYFQYTLEEGRRLTLRALDDELFKNRSFASPEEQKAFVAENIHREELYMDAITFVPAEHLSLQLRTEKE